eukprot:6654689-Pyramimonas_sp.AAC.1
MLRGSVWTLRGSAWTLRGSVCTLRWGGRQGGPCAGVRRTGEGCTGATHHELNTRRLHTGRKGRVAGPLLPPTLARQIASVRPIRRR